MTFSQKNRVKAGALSVVIASLLVGGFVCPSVGCMGAGFNGWIMVGFLCWLALAFIVVCFQKAVDAVFQNGAGGSN